jgi:hypothetical protein
MVDAAGLEHAGVVSTMTDDRGQGTMSIQPVYADLAPDEAVTVRPIDTPVDEDGIDISTTYDGLVVWNDTDPLVHQASGTITWLPESGTVIGFGDTILEVDGTPVILLEGAIPPYRDLEAPSEVSATESGVDLRQLEQSLVSMGFAGADALAPLGEWSGATSDAVERWQLDLGVDPTGVVSQGQVVFLPEPVRISSVTGQLGGSVGGSTPFTVTGTSRHVRVELDPTSVDLIAEGDLVEVTLPDDTVVQGLVRSIADVATTERTGNQSVTYLETEIELEGTDTRYDGAEVTVSVTQTDLTDVLVVPVESLIALAEGGFAVEVLETDGLGGFLVGVEIIGFHGSDVAVEGAVHEGDPVVIP